jgi:hypothetical protein
MILEFVRDLENQPLLHEQVCDSRSVSPLPLQSSVMCIPCLIMCPRIPDDPHQDEETVLYLKDDLLQHACLALKTRRGSLITNIFIFAASPAARHNVVYKHLFHPYGLTGPCLQCPSSLASLFYCASYSLQSALRLILRHTLETVRLSSYCNLLSYRLPFLICIFHSVLFRTRSRCLRWLQYWLSTCRSCIQRVLPFVPVRLTILYRRPFADGCYLTAEPVPTTTSAKIP